MRFLIFDFRFLIEAGAGGARPSPRRAWTARQRGVRAGFTLMELMVAVAILVFIILGVNLVFQGAANAVGTSQSVMASMASERALSGLLDHDLSGIDKNCFLVIRVKREDGVGAIPQLARHFDQCAFIAYGTFPNRTGGQDPVSPFLDNGLTTSAALIWWGQLVLEQAGPLNDRSCIVANQATKIPVNQPPTGAVSLTSAGLGWSADVESEFVVGRRAILLSAAPPQGNAPETTINNGGVPVAAYSSAKGGVDYTTLPVQARNGELLSDITASRISVAAETPGQIMEQIAIDKRRVVNNAAPLIVRTMPGDVAAGSVPGTIYEANHFCYRSAAPATVYDSETGSVVNAYFRMHPMVMPGISSFQIEWTDGALDTDGSSPTFGQLLWYGGTFPATSPFAGAVQAKSKYAGGAGYKGTVEKYIDGTTLANGDTYVATWSLDTPRAMWPKALRFTYHMVDPQGRLKGGRDFVQVVNLPD